jgi:hypothetical protein
MVDEIDRMRPARIFLAGKPHKAMVEEQCDGADRPSQRDSFRSNEPILSGRLDSARCPVQQFVPPILMNPVMITRSFSHGDVSTQFQIAHDLADHFTRCTNHSCHILL